MALIVLVTLAAYAPAMRSGFIWNDSDYVTAPALRSFHGLARIWTDLGATEQYYPLLHSAFWVQHRLFGDHPFGYHLVTLLLHAGSAVGLALILRRMFDGETGPSTSLRASGSGPTPAGQGRGRYEGVEWIAALVFALHPVHVESVAWIAEQKNTLSLAIYLGAVWLYLRFDETRRPSTHLAALGLFSASLACKTVTATLPAALLVILWWKKGRLEWRRDVAPLVPWMALGVAAALFSSWVERAYGRAYGAEFQISAAGRGLVAGRAIWFYALHLLWPVDLNFIYPRWSVAPAAWWQWLYPLGVLAVGAALWLLRRRTRGPLAAYLFFTGSLVPVLGFVNLYGARYSWVWDHWQYLPDLGPLALVVAGLVAAWRWLAPGFRRLGSAGVAALAVLLGGLTWAHAGMFRDEVTLYRRTLALNPDCLMAHFNLGVIWARSPAHLNDAVGEFEAALRVRPGYVPAESSLGVCLLDSGHPEAAVEHLQKALGTPYEDGVHRYLGEALADLHRYPESAVQYELDARLEPENGAAWLGLGNAFTHLGKLEAAAKAFATAVVVTPTDPEPAFALGDTLVALGRYPAAAAAYRRGLALDPDRAYAHANLGNILLQSGQAAAAVAEYREALRERPGDPALVKCLRRALELQNGAGAVGHGGPGP